MIWKSLNCHGRFCPHCPVNQCDLLCKAIRPVEVFRPNANKPQASRGSFAVLRWLLCFEVELDYWNQSAEACKETARLTYGREAIPNLFLEPSISLHG